MFNRYDLFIVCKFCIHCVSARIGCNKWFLSKHSQHYLILNSITRFLVSIKDVMRNCCFKIPCDNNTHVYLLKLKLLKQCILK